MLFLLLLKGVMPCNPDDLQLSLGDVLTAIGLFFTVFQLKQESWAIVLAIRPFWQRRFCWFCLVIGVLLIVIPSLINCGPLNGIYAFLCFIFASGSLLYFADCKSGLFKKNWVRNFFYVLSKKVAYSDDKSIEVSIDIIEANLAAIISCLKNVRISTGKELPLNKKEIYASWADGILSVILSDRRVARYIVTDRYLFLINLLKELKRNEISDAYIDSRLKEIFEELFQNENSFLYRQLDGRGIAAISSLYDIIFSDPFFVVKFKVFGGIYCGGNYQLNEKYLTVYCAALDCSLKTCLEHNGPFAMCDEVCRAMRQTKSYSEILAYGTYKKDEIQKALSCLRKIKFFLAGVYSEIRGYEKQHQNTNPGFEYLQKIYGDCVYGFIEALATVNKEYEEHVRVLGIDLLDVIMDEGKMAQSIRDKIWEKINGKFNSNLHGYFPTILRIYCDLIGPKIDREVGIIEQERARLENFLYQYIKPKILNKVCMRDKNKTPFEQALLPKSVIFNRVTDTFEYLVEYGNTQIMEQNRVDEQ